MSEGFHIAGIVVGSRVQSAKAPSSPRRGRGRGRSFTGRGRGLTGDTEVQTISDSAESGSELEDPSKPHSKTGSSEGEASDVPCEESGDEVLHDAAAPAAEVLERPSSSHAHAPASFRPREKPMDAVATSMWDSTTVWAHNIAVVRRTDTPVFW